MMSFAIIMMPHDVINMVLHDDAINMMSYDYDIIMTSHDDVIMNTINIVNSHDHILCGLKWFGAYL